MVRKIVYTFSVRVITALLSFIIVVVTAKYLGAEARGQISLIMLNISVVVMMSNLLGGGALVFLTPRIELFRLFVPSYVWSILSSLIFTFCIVFFSLVPAGYEIHLFFLSLLLSFTTVNQNILLGKEKVGLFNFTAFIQVALLMLFLLLFVLIQKQQDIIVYVYALYIGYIASFMLSLVPVLKAMRLVDFSGMKESVRRMLKHGFQIQLAYIAQLLNYRFSYYLINFWFGSASVGVFSVGVSLAEAIWLVSKSIATVQYARVSNSEDDVYSRSLTVFLAKYSFIASSILLLILIFLPASFFALLFGKEFTNIGKVILSLGIGIIALSASTIFTHYFSGKGKNKTNTIAAFIGMLFTLLLGLLLIPHYGLTGAGITASVSYTASLLYLMYEFFKMKKEEFKNIFLFSEDIKLFKRLLMTFGIKKEEV